MAEDPVLITVFTPTFNRAHTLPRLADSLASQSFRDYEWLVVDDGSTDGTEALLKDIQAKGDLPLRVIRTANGGKHRAINTGVEAALGPWFFIVDSDDWLPEGSLERLARLTPEAAADRDCCGIIGLRQDPEGQVIGTRLPDSGGFHTTLELHYELGVRGDKAEVFKTEVLRRYPFPDFPGETFVTEALVWNRMAGDGLSLLVVDEALYICEYQADGLSSSSVRLRRRNPRANLRYYSELLACGIPSRARLRPAVNYGRFWLLDAWSSDRRGPGHGFGRDLGRGRILVALGLPLAFLMALKDILVGGKCR